MWAELCPRGHRSWIIERGRDSLMNPGTDPKTRFLEETGFLIGNLKKLTEE
jgi:hypothetical protein